MARAGQQPRTSVSRGVAREGFAGQRLVILPEPVRLSVAGNALLRRLLVTDAGYFPEAGGHCVQRPQGAATHLLIVCLAGRGWVRSGGREEQIHPGDLVWLSADRAHAYAAEPEDPWTIAWVHFRGEEVEDWRRQLGWPLESGFGLTHVLPAQAGELRLDEVCSHLERGYAVPQLLEASAALRVSLAASIGLSQGSRANRSALERTQAVRARIDKDPARAQTLPELALAANLSVPHFTALFRRLTGYPPVDYINRQRIRAACRLLDMTQLGVSQVGASVGFADPYYFSRCFRRVMGCPPLAYRQAVKG